MFERKLPIKKTFKVSDTQHSNGPWMSRSTDYSENKEEDGVNTTRIRTIFKGLFGHFILKQSHLDLSGSWVQLLQKQLSREELLSSTFSIFLHCIALVFQMTYLLLIMLT